MLRLHVRSLSMTSRLSTTELYVQNYHFFFLFKVNPVNLEPIIEVATTSDFT